MNIKIAICDDDKYFVKQLYNKLDDYIWGNNISIHIQNFSSGNELITKIKAGLSVDVIFLDVDLKNDNYTGTEFGVQLKKLNPQLLIIYCTLYDRYLLDVAKSEPFDFLSKPLNDKELDRIISKITERLFYIKESPIFHFKTNGSTSFVDLKKVMYFESRHRIILIHCTNNTYQFYDKLDNVEKIVEEKYPFFVRISKSYYINFNYVTDFSLSHVNINEMTLNISPQYKSNLVEKSSIMFQ